MGLFLSESETSGETYRIFFADYVIAPVDHSYLPVLADGTKSPAALPVAARTHHEAARVAIVFARGMHEVNARLGDRHVVAVRASDESEAKIFTVGIEPNAVPMVTVGGAR